MSITAVHVHSFLPTITSTFIYSPSKHLNLIRTFKLEHSRAPIYTRSVSERIKSNRIASYIHSSISSNYDENHKVIDEEKVEEKINEPIDPN